MPINILHDSLKEELRALLGVSSNTEEFRIDVCLKMAVRDIISEFVDNIGSRTTRDLVIKVEDDLTDGTDISRIYLPDDCWSVRQVMIEGIEVEPVTSDVYEKMKRSGASGVGYFGKTVQREDGRCFLEIYPTITTTDYDIAITYRVASDDVGRIPEIYKNVILYGTAKHWYTFIHVDNPVMKSQMASEYKKYVAGLRADIANTYGSPHLRPYEKEWEKQFLFFVDRNDRDNRR